MGKKVNMRRLLSLVLSLAMATSYSAAASSDSGQSEKTTAATLQNFISDLWEKTDGNGLPTSDFTKEFLDRAISMGVDEDGNALRAIDEQDIRYFNGKYYLYGTDFSYGSFLYASGTNMLPLTTKTQDADGNYIQTFFRYGGLSVYSSDDLMNWKLENTSFIQDEETGFIYTVKKPRVVYSEATGKYVLWFLGENSTGQIYCAEADSPTGPWSDVQHPSFEADNMSLSTDFGQDFDIVEGPDGAHWVVTSHSGIKIYKLDETNTHILEMAVVKESTGGIWSGDGLGGGIGLHWYQDDNGKVYWYVTGSNICGNCISANFYYLMTEDSPMNDWHGPDPENPNTDGLIANTTVMSGAQVHSAKLLPDVNGEMHALIPATHYRANGTQTELKNPGNNALAQGGVFLLTLSYNEDGTIKTIDSMPDSIEFPLANEVDSSAPPAYEAQLAVTKEQSVEYSWTLDGSEPLAAIMPSVFQYTPMYRDNANPIPDQPTGYRIPQEPLVNEPLIATLTLPDGTSQTWEIDPRTVRWAPTQVALNLDKPYTGNGTATLTLSTEAYSDNPFALESNGVAGYGVAVGLASDTADSKFSLANAEYAVVNAEGKKTVREGVDMLMQTSAEALALPTITDQSKSLTLEAYAQSEITSDSWAFGDDPGSATGFYVEAEGVGLGYQWYKDGDPILSPAGWNDSYGPTFRIMYPQVEDSGTYQCYVFNQNGGVWSEPITLTVENSMPFTDVAMADWFYEAVEYVLSNKAMEGTSATKFNPKGKLTRSMLVQVLYNLEGAFGEFNNAFADVDPSAWYADAVNWAAANNIVAGYDDNTFRPTSNITREQMAAILYRYAEYKRFNTSVSADLTNFADNADISDWAVDAMSWAVGSQLLSGKGSGILDPIGDATRAEIAQIMMNFCVNFTKE